MGYNGKDYCGLQMNKSKKTVEDKIIEILFNMEAIDERNIESSKKMGLQRACRTDSGVHAAMNIIVIKIIKNLDFENLKNKLFENKIYLYKMMKVPKGFVAKNRCESRIYKYFIPKTIIKNKEFFTILKNYIGNKNYHNFTIAKNDKGVQRNIIDVNINELEINNNTILEIAIHGQSFMMHQIRKMIGYVLILDRFNKFEVFNEAFKENKFNIPKSPPDFLLLYKPFFNFYNKKFGESHGFIDISENEIEHVVGNLMPDIIDDNCSKIWDVWFETIDKHHKKFEYLQ